MRILPTDVDGAMLVAPAPFVDARGSFARTFCDATFAAAGLESRFVQSNLSTNVAAGTVRGLHFQAGAAAEVKLVQCVRGAVFDVVVDLRPASPTFRQWYGTELSEENGLQLYIPRGCAHGYQTLRGGSAVSYLVSAPYDRNAEGGCRHDDPAFGVRWPLPVASLSDKDAAWPPFGQRGGP